MSGTALGAEGLRTGWTHETKSSSNLAWLKQLGRMRRLSNESSHPHFQAKPSALMVVRSTGARLGVVRPTSVAPFVESAGTAAAFVTSSLRPGKRRRGDPTSASPAPSSLGRLDIGSLTPGRGASTSAIPHVAAVRCECEDKCRTGGLELVGTQGNIHVISPRA